MYCRTDHIYAEQDMSGFLRSLSCKGSSSISVRDQKGSGDAKPSRATFSVEKMTKEEEEMPLADYFQKKGLSVKLKRFIAKLSRNKKGRRPAGTQVVQEKRAPAPFRDQVEVKAQVAGGDGAEEEIAQVDSASPMSTSPATPSALATPSPGKSPGSGRGKRPKFDSRGNRRPPRSEVGKKYFSC